MEGVATTAYTGLRCYWHRMGYRRLGSGSQQQNNSTRRRPFRIRRPKLKRLRLRLRLRLGSVRRFLLKIRDAYVNAMLGFASKGMFYGGGGAMDGGFGGKGHVKEYDAKMLVEIYKKMVLTRQQHQQAIIGSAAGGGRTLALEVSPISTVQ